MNRKLWLEARPLLLAALFLSFGLTLLYVAGFATWGIFVIDDATEFSIGIGPEPDAASLLKAYPNGTLYSLKDAPHNYYKGFDALTRSFWPFVGLLLCAGGILTEKSGGTAAFNLSLPVTRTSWLWRRAAMTSLVTLAAAFLTALFALLLGLWMGLDGSLVWLLTQPVLITLPALPWIGVSLCVQSWTSGFLADPVGAIIVPFFLTGVGMMLFLVNLASPTAGSWGIAIATCAMGAGGMVLATRRFERLDF
jgi:ABC-type transport system involved in multi-copper enzyme maturation permease subunit